MDVCYDGALVLPRNYVPVSEEEMDYIDGGASFWQKAGIIAAVVVGGIALTAAIIYGQFLLAARIMGITIKSYAKKLGAKGVATIIAGATGLGVAGITKCTELVLTVC